MVAANICYFDKPVTEPFVEAFRRLPHGNIVATLVTEERENNFPVLPVRAEHVFVWFSLFADTAEPAELPGDMMRQLSRPIETLRLLPTARSRPQA